MYSSMAPNVGRDLRLAGATSRRWLWLGWCLVGWWLVAADLTLFGWERMRRASVSPYTFVCTTSYGKPIWQCGRLSKASDAPGISWQSTHKHKEANVVVLKLMY